VIPGKGQNRNENSFAVIVPTRNRQNLLVGLLRNLEGTTLSPRIVLIVDSSDCFFDENVYSKTLNIRIIHTAIKSAAQQRNIGLEYILKNFEKSQIPYISFLDDDVRVPVDYLQQIARLFESNSDAVGISGFAKNDSHLVRKRSFLTDFLGITGEPGKMTKAVVNISPFGIEEVKEVDWLIGCSTWRRSAIEAIRFEEDFFGHSLFEDVIFSLRVKKQGKLLYDPNIVLAHLLQSEMEGSLIEHYQDWVKNRYRIFDYSIPKLSKMRFWILTLVLLTSSSIQAFWSARQRKKVLGISKGVLSILKESLPI
jgi:GT2 family glycosyltransferase